MDAEVTELEPEDSMRLQRAVLAILGLVQAPIGLDEKHFRRMLMERGFSVAPTEEAVRH